jgi:hypothetical protein
MKQSNIEEVIEYFEKAEERVKKPLNKRIEEILQEF